MSELFRDLAVGDEDGTIWRGWWKWSRLDVLVRLDRLPNDIHDAAQSLAADWHLCKR